MSRTNWRRLPGVGDVRLASQSGKRTRVEIDLKRLAAHDLTLDEVVRAIQQQTVGVAGGLGRLRFLDEDGANNIILKALPGPRIIYLKDVARAGMREIGDAPRFNGRPVASLFMYPLPGTRLSETQDAIAEKLTELRKRLPNGISLDVDFDFTSNLRRRPNSDYVWIDVSLPGDAERERILAVLQRSREMLKGMEQVWAVLELIGPPFAGVSGQGIILVKLAPDNRTEAERAEIIQSIRDRLAAKIPNAKFRLRDLSGTGRLPPGNYPLEFAVDGPDADKVEKFAAKLAERLSQNPSLIDVSRNPEAAPSRQFSVEFEHAKMAELGIQVGDINNTLAAWRGRESIEGLDQIDLRCTRELVRMV